MSKLRPSPSGYGTQRVGLPEPTKNARHHSSARAKSVIPGLNFGQPEFLCQTATYFTALLGNETSPQRLEHSATSATPVTSTAPAAGVERRFDGDGMSGYATTCHRSVCSSPATHSTEPPGTVTIGNPYHYAGNDPIGRSDPTGMNDVGRTVSPAAHDSGRPRANGPQRRAVSWRWRLRCGLAASPTPSSALLRTW
jgi:hypothetical protein